MEIKSADKQYKTVNHRVFSCQYHVIFCPKYRRRVLVDEVETRLSYRFNTPPDDALYKWFLYQQGKAVSAVLKNGDTTGNFGISDFKTGNLRSLSKAA